MFKYISWTGLNWAKGQPSCSLIRHLFEILCNSCITFSHKKNLLSAFVSSVWNKPVSTLYRYYHITHLSRSHNKSINYQINTKSVKLMILSSPQQWQWSIFTISSIQCWRGLRTPWKSLRLISVIVGIFQPRLYSDEKLFQSPLHQGILDCSEECITGTPCFPLGFTNNSVRLWCVSKTILWSSVFTWTTTGLRTPTWEEKYPGT